MNATGNEAISRLSHLCQNGETPAAQGESAPLLGSRAPDTDVRVLHSECPVCGSVVALVKTATRSLICALCGCADVDAGDGVVVLTDVLVVDGPDSYPVPGRL